MKKARRRVDDPLHLRVRLRPQEVGWAPGHSDDDTFTHIFPGARAVHRRVRVIRAAAAQSGLTLECACEELRSGKEVVVVDAVLDGVGTTRLACRCGISTRRAWHLDAASRNGPRRLAAWVGFRWGVWPRTSQEESAKHSHHHQAFGRWLRLQLECSMLRRSLRV